MGGKPKKKGKLINGDKAVAWDGGQEWKRDKPKPDPSLDGTWSLPDGTTIEVKDGKAKLPDGSEVKLAAPGSTPASQCGTADMYDANKPGSDPLKSAKVTDNGNKLDFGDGKPWTKGGDPKVEGKWFLPDGSEMDIKDGEGTLGKKPVKMKRNPDGTVELVDKATGKPLKKGKLVNGDKNIDWGDGTQYGRDKPKPDPAVECEWFLPDGTPITVKNGKAKLPDGKEIQLAGPGAGSPPNKVNMFDPNNPGGDPTAPTKKGDIKDGGKTLDFGDDKPWSRNKPAKKGGKFDDPYECAPRDIMVELGCEVAPTLDWGKADGTFILKIPAGRGKLKTTCNPPRLSTRSSPSMILSCMWISPTLSVKSCSIQSRESPNLHNSKSL